MKYGKILFQYTLLFIILTLILPGCGTFRESSRTTTIPPATSAIDLSDIGKVKSVLYSHYNEWKSVKYREGGMSKRGIDCSGFVYLTYRSKFGIELPRSTTLQSSLGREIARNNLQAGDLVFFKTGLFQKHVGIYLENRRFLHVSTHNGVMISSMDEQYWSGNYWMAKRIYL